ncbi:SPRY domain-containing protein [Daldinia childiae]|nr:SPRY domain-containing protein [Daldinia childiae]KAF3069881.1 SPRY domain-containing protein [Daldinia childiae]
MPQDYAPPPGPPPSHGQGQSQSSPYYYAPPAGPPPSHHHHHHHQEEYAPPPGPPPSDTKNNPFLTTGTEYAPPPGPPPSHGDSKTHDWQTAVPDTSLLPPPPNFFSGFDRSPANNATEEECEAGESWCAQYPLYAPMPLNPPAEAAARTGAIAMYAPPAFAGALAHVRPGVWTASSPRGARDTCLATYPPLYHAAAHSPLVTGSSKTKTAYYEVRVLERGSRRDEVSLSLGFVAPPYPGFRLPGWHRGSLGVHGDDGHRYVNDRWGGKAFTSPFRVGETVGLGVEFCAAQGGGIRVEVFLTRDGVERGRWNLHEETDREQDLPVTGLEGYHDLCAAVGAFDKVAFEVVFAPELWRWRGYEG